MVRHATKSLTCALTLVRFPLAPQHLPLHVVLQGIAGFLRRASIPFSLTAIPSVASELSRRAAPRPGRLPLHLRRCQKTLTTGWVSHAPLSSCLTLRISGHVFAGPVKIPPDFDPRTDSSFQLNRSTAGRGTIAH